MRRTLFTEDREAFRGAWAGSNEIVKDIISRDLGL